MRRATCKMLIITRLITEHAWLNPAPTRWKENVLGGFFCVSLRPVNQSGTGNKSRTFFKKIDWLSWWFGKCPYFWCGNCKGLIFDEIGCKYPIRPRKRSIKVNQGKDTGAPPDGFMCGWRHAPLLFIIRNVVKKEKWLSWDYRPLNSLWVWLCSRVRARKGARGVIWPNFKNHIISTDKHRIWKAAHLTISHCWRYLQFSLG